MSHIEIIELTANENLRYMHWDNIYTNILEKKLPDEIFLNDILELNIDKHLPKIA